MPRAVPRSSSRLAPPADDKPVRILGIDPGLRITGYGVIEDRDRRPLVREAGVIRTHEGSRSDLGPRLAILYAGIDEVIAQYQPTVVVVEQLFAHYEHPRTAILMGHARGVLMLAAGQRGLPIVSYNASRIKKTITGHGRATKETMQRTMQRELQLACLPEPPDVADALAAALCHYYVVRLPCGDSP